MNILIIVLLSILFCFGCEPKDTTQQESSPTPVATAAPLLQTVIDGATTFEGTPFKMLKTPNVPFEMMFGPYNIKGDHIAPAHKATPAMVAAMLLQMQEAEDQLPGKLQEQLVQNKQVIVNGTMTHADLFLPVARWYANTIAQAVEDFHNMAMVHKHAPFHIAVTSEYMWEFPNMDPLAETLRICDAVGYMIKSEKKLLEMELPDPDPAKVISIKVPYIKVYGLEFTEKFYTPDLSTVALVKSLLPAKLLHEPKYLRIRSVNEALNGIFTPLDLQNTIVYPKAKMMNEFAGILRDSHNVFPFKDLTATQQQAILHQIHIALVRHEQVHVMTSKVGMMKLLPSCNDCENEIDGLMEAMAYIVSYVQGNNQTRYAITQLIEKGTWEPNKLTHDLWILPLAMAIGDRDTKHICENKDGTIDISCQFEKKMVTDEIVHAMAKKAMEYIAKEIVTKYS